MRVAYAVQKKPWDSPLLSLWGRSSSPGTRPCSSSGTSSFTGRVLAPCSGEEHLETWGGHLRILRPGPKELWSGGGVRLRETGILEEKP